MITNQYSSWKGVSPQEIEKILEEIKQTEGFSIVREIFRGMIYNENKVGSVIYLVEYNGAPAVLKLQILKLLAYDNCITDESNIIKSFTKQNRSRLVRMPELLSSSPWGEDKKYGYLITEYIDAPFIFSGVLATPEEMQIFIEFYVEYLKSIPAEPWIPEKKYTLAEVFCRVDNWAEISRQRMKELYAQTKERMFNWEENGLEKKLERYKEILERNQNISVKFQHKHLTGRDIRVLPDGTFVVFSNIYWGYMPEWYDTTFHIWASLKSVRDKNFSSEDAKSYIEKWLEAYKTIQPIKSDSDFEKKFYLNLFERMLGTLLVDLTADDLDLDLEDKKHLFRLHEELFEWVAGKL